MKSNRHLLISMSLLLLLSSSAVAKSKDSPTEDAATKKPESIKVLLDRKAKLQETDPQYGPLLFTLGKAYLAAGDLTKAEETLKKSIVANLKKGPTYDAGTALDSVNTLYDIYKQQNRLDDAYVLTSNTAPWFSKVGPSDERAKKFTSYMVSSMLDSNLGPLKTSAFEALLNGNYVQAIERYNSVLKQVEAHDPNGNCMAMTLESLGEAYFKAGEYSKAEEVLTKAAPMLKKDYPQFLPKVEQMINECRANK